MQQIEFSSVLQGIESEIERAINPLNELTPQKLNKLNQLCEEIDDAKKENFSCINKLNLLRLRLMIKFYLLKDISLIGEEYVQALEEYKKSHDISSLENIKEFAESFNLLANNFYQNIKSKEEKEKLTAEEVKKYVVYIDKCSSFAIECYRHLHPISGYLLFCAVSAHYIKIRNAPYQLGLFDAKEDLSTSDSVVKYILELSHMISFWFGCIAPCREYFTHISVYGAQLKIIIALAELAHHVEKSDKVSLCIKPLLLEGLKRLAVLYYAEISELLKNEQRQREILIYDKDFLYHLDVVSEIAKHLYFVETPKADLHTNTAILISILMISLESDNVARQIACIYLSRIFYYAPEKYKIATVFLLIAETDPSLLQALADIIFSSIEILQEELWGNHFPGVPYDSDKLRQKIRDLSEVKSMVLAENYDTLSKTLEKFPYLKLIDFDQIEKEKLYKFSPLKQVITSLLPALYIYGCICLVAKKYQLAEKYFIDALYLISPAVTFLNLLGIKNLDVNENVLDNAYRKIKNAIDLLWQIIGHNKITDYPLKAAQLIDEGLKFFYIENYEKAARKLILARNKLYKINFLCPYSLKIIELHYALTVIHLNERRIDEAIDLFGTLLIDLNKRFEEFENNNSSASLEDMTFIPRYIVAATVAFFIFNKTFGNGKKNKIDNDQLKESARALFMMVAACKNQGELQTVEVCRTVLELLLSQLEKRGLMKEIPEILKSKRVVLESEVDDKKEISNGRNGEANKKKDLCVVLPFEEEIKFSNLSIHRLPAYPPQLRLAVHPNQNQDPLNYYFLSVLFFKKNLFLRAEVYLQFCWFFLELQGEHVLRPFLEAEIILFTNELRKNFSVEEQLNKFPRLNLIKIKDASRKITLFEPDLRSIKALVPRMKQQSNNDIINGDDEKRKLKDSAECSKRKNSKKKKSQSKKPKNKEFSHVDSFDQFIQLLFYAFWLIMQSDQRGEIRESKKLVNDDLEWADWALVDARDYLEISVSSGTSNYKVWYDLFISAQKTIKLLREQLAERETLERFEGSIISGQADPRVATNLSTAGRLFPLPDEKNIQRQLLPFQAAAAMIQVS